MEASGSAWVAKDGLYQEGTIPQMVVVCLMVLTFGGHVMPMIFHLRPFARIAFPIALKQHLKRSQNLRRTFFSFTPVGTEIRPKPF